MSISTKPQGPVENRLLAALPDKVLARLLPHLQPVSFALGSKPNSTGCSARDAPQALGYGNDSAANLSPVFGVLAIIELGNAG